MLLLWLWLNSFYIIPYLKRNTFASVTVPWNIKTWIIFLYLFSFYFMMLTLMYHYFAFCFCIFFAYQSPHSASAFVTFFFFLNNEFSLEIRVPLSCRHKVDPSQFRSINIRDRAESYKLEPLNLELPQEILGGPLCPRTDEGRGARRLRGGTWRPGVKGVFSKLSDTPLTSVCSRCTFSTGR